MKEHKLNLFGFRVLRRIIIFERDEITGVSRKLHNEGLH
jgi:hypothetical protein